MARDRLSRIALANGARDARQAHKASERRRAMAWAHKRLDRESASNARLSLSTFTIARPHHASRGIPFDHYSVMHKAEGKEFTFRYRRDALACAEAIAATGEYHPGFPQADLAARQQIEQSRLLAGAAILLDRANDQAKPRGAQSQAAPSEPIQWLSWGIKSSLASYR